MKKKYWLHVTEEACYAEGYRGGRISVHDLIGYPGEDPLYRSEALEEYRWLLPAERADYFRKAIDGIETDGPIYIKLDWRKDL